MLTACSDERPAIWPNEHMLVEAAVRAIYPGTYETLEELRRDYPGFSTRVRRWGPNRFSVDMPDELVILDAQGKIHATRNCGSTEGDCEQVIPAKPELGVVGTVQYGDPEFARATGISAMWQGSSKGYVFESGNCFAAHKASATEPLTLKVVADGNGSVEFHKKYGFYLVAVTFDLKRGGTYYGNVRIPRKTFLDSNTCSPAAREAWPNVGGASWKR